VVGDGGIGEERVHGGGPEAVVFGKG
jgi:hypothetical protein